VRRGYSTTGGRVPPGRHQAGTSSRVRRVLERIEEELKPTVERQRCEMHVARLPCGCIRMVNPQFVHMGGKVSLHFVAPGLVCVLSARRFRDGSVMFPSSPYKRHFCRLAVHTVRRVLGLLPGLWAQTEELNLSLFDLSSREGETQYQPHTMYRKFSKSAATCFANPYSILGLPSTGCPFDYRILPEMPSD
jgi:hypothetical protein